MAKRNLDRLSLFIIIAFVFALNIIGGSKLEGEATFKPPANRFSLYGESSGGSWDLVGVNNRIEIRFKNEDYFDFASLEKGRFDLIIANAFLDLVDIRASLPLMSELLEKGGLFYFTINFDGLTVLEPAIDEEIDDLILNLYHKTMDERMVNGKLSGDSRAGRHLFSCLKEAEMQIIDAGASDWVVFPEENGYRQDDSYFLHFILNRIRQALIGRALQDSSELDPGRLNDWICKRHNQVDNNELIYIAHQIDFVGITG